MSNLLKLSLVFAFLSQSCTYISYVIPTPGPDGGPMEDASVPMMEGDAASAPDAGVDAGNDAGNDAGVDSGPVLPPPAVTIVFDGPAAGDIQLGTQDNVMYSFSVTARVDVEIRFLDFNIEGVTSADRLVGSAGTDLFGDIKLKDLDTGTTLMGPIALASSSRFTDSFVIHAGETRHLGITMDVSNSEDAPGEFFDGTHSYRVTVGTSGTFFENVAVREIATGVFIDASHISNDVVIPGNAQTIVEVQLLASTAATPVLTVAVRKEMNIPSVGILLSASADDVAVNSILLRGVGDVDGTATYADLQHVVTSCALFNGATQIGLSQAPDTDGFMRITGLGLTVASGTTLTLTVRCTADSVVTDGEDRFSIGIGTASGIDAIASDGSAVTPTVSRNLLENSAPGGVNFVRVLNSGTITIATNSLRQSTILVAGGDVWQNFAQYQATAQYEGVDIDEVRVTSRGDAASFTWVAVALEGAVLGMCILPAGADRSCDVHLTTPIHVDRDASRIFQIWGKLADVVSSTSVVPGTPRCSGYACSGARLRLGIEAGVTTGHWDVNYSASLNVRSTGTVSGDRLFNTSSTLLGNEFVVRRSKPVFVRQSVSDPTLSNGLDMDLYRFQVAADSAGSVAIMGFRFRMSMSGSGTVSSLGIRRSITEIAGATVTYDGTYVVVTFASEETVTGSGNVYTLHGVTNGFFAGDSVLTAPYRSVSVDTAVTGYVGSGMTLDTGSGSLLVGILWSDMSEVPHAAGPRALGGSFDWTGDFYVEDMTQSQVLTR